jgi:hypothetical protein
MRDTAKHRFLFYGLIGLIFGMIDWFYLDGLRVEREIRYWIERKVTEGNISDIQVNSGQMSTGVEILLTTSRST